MKRTSKPVQGNEESKTVENNSSIILHEYSLEILIHKRDYMQRKFEIDQAIATHEGLKKATFECKPLPSSGDFRSLELNYVELSRLESEHIDLFDLNELLVGKKLHPVIALLLFLEKLKAVPFFHMQNEVKLFLCSDSFFLPLYKTRG